MPFAAPTNIGQLGIVAFEQLFHRIVGRGGGDRLSHWRIRGQVIDCNRFGLSRSVVDCAVDPIVLAQLHAQCAAALGNIQVACQNRFKPTTISNTELSWQGLPGSITENTVTLQPNQGLL